MGPKKKGKGSKLARMSDEERARYLQHRAAVEEEARRRKQQLIATFIKNKLKKEEAFSRLNVAKINHQWRQTLRVIKCKELQQDFDALHNWFDHTADKKSQLVECLLSDLQEAESQYSRIHQSHMDTIEKLLGIFNGRISVLQGSFEERRDAMFTSACNEMDRISMGAETEQEHLHAIIFQMEQTRDKETIRTKTAQNTRAEELRNHMMTELENLTNGREMRMQTLWASFQNVLQKHWDQTEDRRREYLNLRQADEENCQHVFNNHQQIRTLNDVLSHLRIQLSGENSDGVGQLAERKADREECMHLFQMLRHKLNTERTGDQRKLIRMSDAANKSTRDLEKTLSNGQQILQIIKLIKKFENPSEISSSIDDKEELSATVEVYLHDQENPAFGDVLVKEAFNNFSKLRGFWRKFNKCSIEKEALYLECQVLENEQRQLKSALKKYFTDLSDSRVLPVAPLTIHRPHSHIKDRKSMSLKGEKITSQLGKVATFDNGGRVQTFVHTLMVQLAKQ